MKQQPVVVEPIDTILSCSSESSENPEKLYMKADGTKMTPEEVSEYALKLVEGKKYTQKQFDDAKLAI